MNNGFYQFYQLLMMVAGITTVAVVVARSFTSALVVASINTVAIGIV